MFRKLIRKFLLWACKDEVIHLIESESREYNQQLTARVNVLQNTVYVLQRDVEFLDSTVTSILRKQSNEKKNKNARKAMRNGL